MRTLFTMGVNKSNIIAESLLSVIGVFKAYLTQVGSGPFPTELFDSIGERMRAQGHEFGTTTGRSRRCGWFDGVAAKHSILVNGINEISITKLDVLNGFEDIRFCVAYDSLGNPLYKNFEGWDVILDIKGNIHPRAQEYMNYMSEFLGVPIHSFAYGPERKEIRLTKLSQTSKQKIVNKVTDYAMRVMEDNSIRVLDIRIQAFHTPLGEHGASWEASDNIYEFTKWDKSELEAVIYKRDFE